MRTRHSRWLVFLPALLLAVGHFTAPEEAFSAPELPMAQLDAVGQKLRFMPNLAPTVCNPTTDADQEQVGFFSDFESIVMETDIPFLFCTERGSLPIRKISDEEMKNIPSRKVPRSDVVREGHRDFQNTESVSFSLNVFPSTRTDLPDHPPLSLKHGAFVRFFAGMVEHVFAQTNNGFRADGLSVAVRDMGDNELNVPLAFNDAGDHIDLTLDPLTRLRPGRYRLSVGVLRDGVIYETEQDFTWGVLAMNTYKSTFRVGETGTIGIGVLDDGGHTLCDADVRLDITDPRGDIRSFTRVNGGVSLSPECADANVTELPDYTVAFAPQTLGTYTLSLTAITQNGSRSIQKTVDIVDAPEMTVRRSGSMRIYPVADYRMEINLYSRRQFSGEIREPVESSFKIYNISSGGKLETAADGSKSIVWRPSLKANTGMQLSYTYDAPNVSPEFFRLGPIALRQGAYTYAEPRSFDIASDSVASDGVLFYGDTTTTNQGDLRVRNFTAPTTWATEFSVDIGTDTSFILWTTARTAVTREEIMIGTLKVDGQLNITSCTTGCNAAGDFTSRWNNPGTTATQDCDSAPTVGTCFRGFDIGYESMSGRTLVVYGDNVTDKVYYALWDGSSWSPNSSPGSPGVSNEVDLPGTAGTPQWIRVVPAGENLADERSNRIMVLVADDSANLYGLYWNGSTFSGHLITSNLQNCTLAQCFDGNWQKNSTFVLSYGSSDDATNDIEYRTVNVDTGVWGDETQAYTTNAAAQWVQSAAGPKSTRILVSTSANGNDYRSAVWRGDDATDAWTVCSATGCPDTTTETVTGQQAWNIIQGVGGSGLTIYNDAGTTADSNYFTIDFPSTWGTKTRTTITTSDDSLQTKAWLYPNDDDVMVMSADVDCDTYAALWNGASFETATVDLEANNSMYGVACPNLTAPGTDPGGAPFSYDFAWKGYSPWSRNWRFYSDISSGDPSTGYGGATENQPATDVAIDDYLRLRMQFQELTFAAETDSRKTLQWTTDDPNDNSATWTDVGNTDETSAVWRFATSGETCILCIDGTAVVTARLTGTTQNGTYISSRNDAAGLLMDHSAQAILEVDYPLKAENVVAGTTYYFRAFDVQQERPVFRRQDNGAACLSTNCTYPSLTIAAAAATKKHWFYILD